ncbi:MAG: hypothetical protein GEU74_14440 [Nitriliruptorales bacterium]|nr:hypothetical protein [Nitriliruptorales bacterium]
MPAPTITLRTVGLTALAEEAVIRFGTIEPHQMIKSALATADRYDRVVAALGLPPQQVLVVSCFAGTDGWSPAALAAFTGYDTYHVTTGATIQALGYELWPTDIVDEFGEPDPRNAVHFDLVIARDLTATELADRTAPDPDARRTLRAWFIPAVLPLLDALEGPMPLA